MARQAVCGSHCRVTERSHGGLDGRVRDWTAVSKCSLSGGGYLVDWRRGAEPMRSVAPLRATRLVTNRAASATRDSWGGTLPALSRRRVEASQPPIANVVADGGCSCWTIGRSSHLEGPHRLGLAMKKGSVSMSEQRKVSAALFRGLMDGVEDVAGKKGRDLALRQAGLDQYIDNPPANSETESLPAEQYVALVGALYDVFGKGSKAMLIYAGEQAMRRGTESMPSFFGPVLRFVPGGLKKQAIFRLMASRQAKITGVPATVKFEKGRVTVSDTMCSSCSGRHSDEPMCHFEVGVHLAAAEWTTGKKHRVTEVECRAMGDEACVYVIAEVEGNA